MAFIDFVLWQNFQISKSIQHNNPLKLSCWSTIFQSVHQNSLIKSSRWKSFKFVSIANNASKFTFFIALTWFGPFEMLEQFSLQTPNLHKVDGKNISFEKFYTHPVQSTVTHTNRKRRQKEQMFKSNKNPNSLIISHRFTHCYITNNKQFKIRAIEWYTASQLPKWRKYAKQFSAAESLQFIVLIK